MECHVHCMPQAAMMTMMAAAMAGHGGGELSSQDAQKLHELQALMLVMKNVPGIEIDGHSE